jgi:hypothetical protein
MSKKVRDKLTRDACEAQKQRGELPDSERHQRNMAEICEYIDRKNADQVHAPLLEADPETNPHLQVDVIKLNHEGLLLRQRVLRILADPKLRQRLLGPINPFASKGNMGVAAQRKCGEHYMRVLEESNRLWGPWQQERLLPDPNIDIRIAPKHTPIWSPNTGYTGLKDTEE